MSAVVDRAGGASGPGNKCPLVPARRPYRVDGGQAQRLRPVPVIPLLAVLFIYESAFRTVSNYPALWSLRASVVLDKFYPAAPACPSPQASPRGPGRVRAVAGLVTWWGPPPGPHGRGSCAIARPARWPGFWPRSWSTASSCCTYAPGKKGNLGRAAALAGRGRRRRRLTAVCTPRVACTLGGAVPRPVHRPDRRRWASRCSAWPWPAGHTTKGGASVLRALPGQSSSLGTTRAPSTPSRRMFRSSRSPMFFAGCVLGAVGLLGLSPRTRRRRVAWCPARSCERRRGARLRAVATSSSQAKHRPCDCRVRSGRDGEVVAIEQQAASRSPPLTAPAADKPIPYTPVCADALPQPTSRSARAPGLPELPQPGNGRAQRSWPRWPGLPWRARPRRRDPRAGSARDRAAGQRQRCGDWQPYRHTSSP